MLVFRTAVICMLLANALCKPVHHTKHRSHHALRSDHNNSTDSGTKRGYDVDCTETRCNWGRAHPCGGHLARGHHLANHLAHQATLLSQDAHRTPNMVDHCCERGAFKYTECINGHEFPAVLQQQHPHVAVVTGVHHGNTVLHGNAVGYHGNVYNHGYHHGYHPNNVVYHGNYHGSKYHNGVAAVVHDNGAVVHDNAALGYHDNAALGYHDNSALGYNTPALPVHAYGNGLNHGALDSTAYPEHIVGATVHTVAPKNGTADYADVAASLASVPASIPALSHQDAATQAWPVVDHAGVAGGFRTVAGQENVVDSLNNVNVAVAPAANTHDMFNLAHTIPQLAPNADGQLAHTNMGLTDSDVIAANAHHDLPAATPAAGPLSLSGRVAVAAPSNATIIDPEVQNSPAPVGDLVHPQHVAVHHAAAHHPHVVAQLAGQQDVAATAQAPLPVNDVQNAAASAADVVDNTVATPAVVDNTVAAPAVADSALTAPAAIDNPASAPVAVENTVKVGNSLLRGGNAKLLDNGEVDLNCGPSRITLTKTTIVQEGVNPHNTQALLQRFCNAPSTTTTAVHHPATATVAHPAVAAPATQENPEVYVPEHENSLVDATPAVEAKVDADGVPVEGKVDGHTQLVTAAPRPQHVITNADTTEPAVVDEEPTPSERNSADILVASSDVMEGPNIQDGVVGHRVRTGAHRVADGVVPVAHDGEVETIGGDELNDPTENAYKKGKHGDVRTGGHSVQKKRTYSHSHHRNLNRIPAT